MRTSLPLLAALALAVGSAQAHDKPRNLLSFDAYDRNNDGVITKREAAGHPRLMKRFDAIDTNNDNRISRKEWVASRGKAHVAKRPSSSQDARFSSLDRNKDGVLNRSEARGHLEGSASTGR